MVDLEVVLACFSIVFDQVLITDLLCVMKGYHMVVLANSGKLKFSFSFRDKIVTIVVCFDIDLSILFSSGYFSRYFRR